MYAPGRTLAGAGNSIVSPRQADLVHGAAAQEAAQSTIKLPSTGTVRYWWATLLLGK